MNRGSAACSRTPTAGTLCRGLCPRGEDAAQCLSEPPRGAGGKTIVDKVPAALRQHEVHPAEHPQVLGHCAGSNPRAPGQRANAQSVVREQLQNSDPALGGQGGEQRCRIRGGGSPRCHFGDSHLIKYTLKRSNVNRQRMTVIDPMSGLGGIRNQGLGTGDHGLSGGRKRSAGYFFSLRRALSRPITAPIRKPKGMAIKATTPASEVLHSVF
jgi:hypothetical protein